MTDEEIEIKNMRLRLNMLEEKLRLTRVSRSFPDTPIVNCYFYTDVGNVGKINEPRTDGKVFYTLDGRSWQGTPPKSIHRLYTREEVEYILAEKGSHHG